MRWPSMVVCGMLIALAVGCGDTDGEEPGEAASAASTTSTTFGMSAAQVRVLSRRIGVVLAELPVGYNGIGFPGGSNQADVAGQWRLAAGELQDAADELAAAGGAADDAVAALERYAAGLEAIGECIAADDPNFGGTRIVGAGLCDGLNAQVAEDGRAASELVVRLADSL